MATQPTNAGIDFQQRVSAWIIINMIIEMDLSFSLDVEKNTFIKKVEFESDDAIDDLVITLLDNRKMYFQMKRSVSLTQSETSDFYKALYQFVKAYSIDSDSASSYVLVTSSKASSPIKDELRKIFTSVRYNPLTFLSNPLTKSENDSFSKFRKLTKDIFQLVNETEMTEEEFIKFLTKIYIVVLDIEDGMPLEKVVLLTIHNHINTKTPDLFWSFIIKSALNFASQRQSLLKETLINKWKHLLEGNSNENPENESILDEFLQFEITNSFSMGKDIVLAEFVGSSLDLPNPINNEELNPDVNDTLFIIELFRFNDDGTKRISYSDEEFLTLKSGLSFRVLCRTATNHGMERYLKENEHLKSKKLIIMAANDIEGVEQEEHVKIYAEQCKTYLEKNPSLNCIHCGRGVSQNNSYIIEIDDIENYPMLGMVHDECIRPLDRILGVIKSDLFEEYYFLNNFDYKMWLECLKESQAFMGGINKMMNSSGVIYAMWNPYNYPNNTFKYCIKVNLKNGDFRYSKIRGKVERLNKSESKRRAIYFNEQIEKQKIKDPWCFTSKSSTFGTYSQLLRTKMSDEDILECESAEVVIYTDHIGKQHNENINFYAPLCTITSLANDALFTINGCPILISNPFELKHYLNNWEEAGIKIDDYEINIISTDLEFDNFMREVTMSGVKPIINPILDRKQILVSGVIVQNINELLRGK
ncbi:hypothetical protein [Brevibacillus panacihumi]|uniref:hypothetical protein n=1 Tax=Brevibacillus panacihumi TaxID=497735 RepID=UPI003D1F3C9D